MTAVPTGPRGAVVAYEWTHPQTGEKRMLDPADVDVIRPAADLPSIKTLLEIRYAIGAGRLHRFRWVAPRAIYEELLATLAPKDDLTMVVGPQQQTLLGIKLRVDDTVPGLYLEWIE